jgi:hypothetical protein
MKAWYGEELLTAEGAKKVKGYKYQGGDLSLIYKHVTGPLAQWVVDTFYPPTLA